MVVIAHEHPGMHTPPGHLAGLAERVKEEAAVIVIVKNVLATVPTRHDVIISPGGLDADAACHAPLSMHEAYLSSFCTLTPFPP